MNALLHVLAGVASIGVLAFFVLVKAAPADRLGFASSKACLECHREEAHLWQESLHTKMMRPAGDASALVARFADEDEGRRFEFSEAVWVIGGKWEQQFMGHNGETETLLPGAWHVQGAEWDFSGWDGWEAPVPVRRCHGCHTVGLDPSTGTWIEENIGCESCHGPSRWHAETLGLGQVHSSADPLLCAQCHVRGKSESGDYFYPLEYRPGEASLIGFREDEPQLGRNTSSWWGNGFERKRHQQYTAWRIGGHAESLSRLRDDYDGRHGAVTEDCLRCHSGDYLLSKGRARPSVETAKYGITCSVCHATHGPLDRARMDCGDCHEGGAFYHRPELNAEHVACGEDADVGCVGCHMPQVVKTGGGYPLHSHRPGVVPPEDSLRFEMPNSCQNGVCHANQPVSWAVERFSAHYGD